MSNKKITQLAPAAVPLTGVEIAPVVQSAATVQTTVANILGTAAGASLIVNTPAGTIAATTVQGAINEIVSDLAASSGSSLVGYLPSGTGAVATTAQSKLRASVSVLDFGADSTGVADSTAAIQAAITYAITLGNSVYIPAGVYNYTSLTITAAAADGGLIIYGDSTSNTYFGNGSILNCTAASGNSVTVTGSACYLSLRNLSFKGNANVDNGVVFSSSWFFDINECVFGGYTKATASAVVMSANLVYSGTCKIRNSHFQTNATGIFSKGGASGTPQVNFVGYYGCTFLDHAVVAIQVGANAGPIMQARSHTIRNCDFEGNVRDILTYATMLSLNILENYFENNNVAHTAARIDLIYDGVSPSGSAISITGNYFQKTLASAGAYIVGLSGDTISVLNNRSSSGGLTDRWFLYALSTSNIEAEPASSPNAPNYPVFISGGGVPSGKSYSSLVNKSLRTEPLVSGATNAQVLYQGSGTPNNALGNSGDLYFNSASTGANANGRDSIWQKGASFWRQATYLADVSNPTYGASITIDMAISSIFVVTATNSTSFSINSPTNSGTGQVFTVVVANTSGGALGTCTFDASFYRLGSAWTQPATGFRRAITFYWDAVNVKAYEISRTAADVSN